MAGIRFATKAKVVSGDESLGTPVTAEYVAGRLMKKTIEAVGYSSDPGDPQDLQLNLSDGGFVTFEVDRSGPVVVYYPPSK